MKRLSLAAFVVALAVATEAQSPPANPRGLFDALTFRSIGPAAMGGRVDDIAVLEANPSTFYVAAATGGLWKTTNNGITFEVLFQDEDVVSIGDVALPPKDPNLVWVGTGEANNRQSSSWGGGVYKSIDGGRTWTNMGLVETRHIGRVLIDPANHDIVFVAAQGHLWGPNPERGIFKTTDGGRTWKKTLFVDDDTGGTDLVMDPSDNRILYAAMYQRRRATWGFNGGGPGSGIYKSTDAGDTWTRLTNGLPPGPLGRIGLDVYRRNPNVVYALVQHETASGLYRSDDAGASWRRMSDTNPRPMYFSQVRVDPNNDQRVYVAGVQLHISDDGGKTFAENATLHPDHHAIWIDPENSQHVMTGNDGGLGVSYDGGRKWAFVDTLVLAQFYHVGYDMDVPYRVYGGLQDNRAWSGPSAVRLRHGIANWDWFSVGSGDGFVAFADPTDSRIVYSESQGGNVVRVDRATNERKVIKPAVSAGEPALRWNWDTPLMLSPHNPNVLVMAANKVLRSTDRGHSWQAISPDLTAGTDRDTFSLMGVRGSDIRLSRNDGISSWPTLTALAESPKKPGLYYTGSEDGALHISRDGGKTWTNISGGFPGVPKQAYVSRVTPSAFVEGRVYVSFNNHREDDYRPYLFVSEDFGSTWKPIASTLPAGHAVNCITEDTRNPAVLYVGTEFGLFVSLDQGTSWARLKNNLPTVPIFEITIHPRENDLLLATHGRGIWILDDLAPIQGAAEAITTNAYLFQPRPAWQFNPSEERTPFLGDQRFWGTNPEPGVALSFYLNTAPRDVLLSIRDASGGLVRQIPATAMRRAPAAGVVNRVNWDLRHEPLRALTRRAGGSAGTSNGPFVLPGRYSVVLSVGGRDAASREVEVRGDPVIQISDADRLRLHDTALALHGLHRVANEAAEAVAAMSDAMQKLASLAGSSKVESSVVQGTAEINQRLTKLRRSLGVPAPGGSGRAAGGGEAEEGSFSRSAVRPTIASLKGQVMQSTSLPTEMQTRAVTSVRQDLAAIVSEVNALITNTMPGVQKVLTQNGIQMETLKPIPSVTTSSSFEMEK